MWDREQQGKRQHPGTVLPLTFGKFLMKLQSPLLLPQAFNRRFLVLQHRRVLIPRARLLRCLLLACCRNAFGLSYTFRRQLTARTVIKP